MIDIIILTCNRCKKLRFLHICVLYQPQISRVCWTFPALPSSDQLHFRRPVVTYGQWVLHCMAQFQSICEWERSRFSYTCSQSVLDFLCYRFFCHRTNTTSQKARCHFVRQWKSWVWDIIIEIHMFLPAKKPSLGIFYDASKIFTFPKLSFSSLKLNSQHTHQSNIPVKARSDELTALPSSQERLQEAILNRNLQANCHICK